MSQQGKGKDPLSASPYPGEKRPAEESGRRIRVVIAEDNRADVLLVREALEHHGFEAQLTIQRDGEEMLSFIDRMEAGEVPCPDVVLLDLNLPRWSGEALLARIRQSRMCSDVPVVIVTSSDALRDREATARLGANSYFRKPSDYDEFLSLGAIVKDVLGRTGGGYE